MSCGLTKGRKIGCFDNIGGIKNVFLSKFYTPDFLFSLKVKEGDMGNLDDERFFKYETINAIFSETIVNDDQGVSFEQSLTFTLFKQDLITTTELDLLTTIDLRYVVEFNDGSFRMGGALNAAKLTNYTIDSGGAKSSLNGYRLTFTSVEEYCSPFTDPITEGYLLLENGFYLLLESGGKIIL